jgi:hypothetical protein
LVVVCLVDRTTVEVEWQVPLARVGAFIPFWLTRIDLKNYIDGRWFNMRSSRATRAMWRILDGKGREWTAFMFGAPKVVAPPVSIKACVSWALRNKH